uniref:YobI-like P-loop NTPase domain-containing protein n=1 Tax=Sphingobacterium sp. (strain 21) TaxID=743722 RepID=F4C8W1_SPHS2
MKFFSFLNRSKKKVTQAENTISSLAPRVLTKKEDIEKIQPYLDKLKETIDAKGINNIALTGGYGSGKSTIIKTFRALHPENKYLNISLAAFNKKEDSPTDPQKSELERLLEVSILQQIFYHVKPEQIPESRFKRIINISKPRIWLISFGFITWLLCTILSFKYNYLNKINPATWNTNQYFDWFALFILLIAFSGIGIFSKLVIQLFSNSKINKVNIKGELELGENVNKSVFNEHLEEILYFFERTDFNVVIIEDLDRFDSTDIFTKLREINVLLNNSKLIEREINFLYAVGDSLFKDKKERVKFFEYIIPVIPFINSSNANEQLTNLIKDSGLEENIFTKEFISDVITFIDDIDMRLLINIFHEFVIYRDTLKPEFVKKPEELFSMITYKNIEPEDFADLNSRKGKLYNLISSKKTYTEQLLSKIDEEIKRKRERIHDLKQQSLSDIRELRAIYINYLLSELPENSFLNHSTRHLLDDDGFEKVIKGDLQYTRFIKDYGGYYPSGNLTLTLKFSEIENKVNPTHSYSSRLEIAKEKAENRIDALQADIEKLRLRKAEIESWELKRIFEEITLDEYLINFSNNALLRNLILNGYINENYNDYISLFHEGSITKEDLTFERNVKGGYPVQFNYKLHKIEGLLERIDLRYFSRESILNFDLLDFLGNNYDKYSNQYNAMIALLSNERENSIKFIDEYVKEEKTRPIHIFIEKLTAQWKDFFYYVTEESNFNRDKIDNYLRLMLSYTETQTILDHQNHDTLSEMIMTNPKFLSLVKKDGGQYHIFKIKEIIKGLNIKFDALDDPNEETKKLFDFVYQNNHYRITNRNILQMLTVYDEAIDLDTFNTKNYSCIKHSGQEHLINYIDQSINEYVESVYLKINDNIREEEQYLIELLNHSDIRDRNKKAIIERTETLIADISKIDDEEFRVFILIKNKVKRTWRNIFHLYQSQEGISEEIISYINIPENAQLLSSQNISLDKDENGKMLYFQMWKDVLASPELSIESFKTILNSSSHRIRIFPIEAMPDDRMEIMIKEKKFAFENKIYDQIDSDGKLRLKFLEAYKDELLMFDDKFEIDEEHVTEMLGSENYDADDINRILEIYEVADWDSHAFLSNLRSRLSRDPMINIDTNKILEATSVQQFDIYNVNILNNYFDKFNKSEIRSIVEDLKDEEYHKYLSVATKESLKLEHTTYNRELFELMKKHNYIGEKSREIKNGYQIFKNKETKVL